MIPSHSLLYRMPPEPGLDSNAILSPSAIERDSKLVD
jgi:hypothetical protein